MMALSATLEGSSQMALLARTTRARLTKRTERERPNSECPILPATTPVSRTHVSRMSRTGRIDCYNNCPSRRRRKTKCSFVSGCRLSSFGYPWQRPVGRELAFPGRNGHGPSISWVRKPLGVKDGRVEDSDEVGLDGPGHGFVLCFHRVRMGYHLPLHTAGVKTVLPLQYACHPASFCRRREMIMEPGAAFVPNFPR